MAHAGHLIEITYIELGEKLTSRRIIAEYHEGKGKKKQITTM